MMSTVNSMFLVFLCVLSNYWRLESCERYPLEWNCNLHKATNDCAHRLIASVYSSLGSLVSLTPRHTRYTSLDF